MTGRKPKPTAMKIVGGNPGKRPINGREPKPRADLPICPEWIDDDGKAEWNSIVPELKRMGLLSVVDKAALAGYCQSFADVADAVRTLAAHGSKMIKTEKGNVVQHPAVGMKNRAMLIMAKFLTEFGLSPSSRARLVVPGGGGSDSEDEMEAFLSGEAI